MILLNFATEIKGTSTVEKHKDWIAVDSMSFGVGRAIHSVSGGKDRETSNPSFSELTFTKSTDISSGDLFMQSICGKSLGKAQIHFIQTGGTEANGQHYLSIELTDAIVSSYSISSSGERPVETFSLNYTQINFKYDAFDGTQIAAGTLKGWDLLKNQKI
ncbi:type VI secretion system secreted protein Hcp [Chitinivorax tropicus]|uniref:Type VI secretion system secreted protein Hcp n=1 Tax=Chitinivorax tropicus TaxID=714531 RepID=A0A840MLW6_9PROT|nr:type VI secretion system tube protein Hcp [Chitinivorax tropicus]MBB5020144.1 type VI secretion system secreted protein Hcp [Chitinivorax tropicus]